MERIAESNVQVIRSVIEHDQQVGFTMQQGVPLISKAVLCDG